MAFVDSMLELPVVNLGFAKNTKHFNQSQDVTNMWQTLSKFGAWFFRQVVTHLKVIIVITPCCKVQQGKRYSDKSLKTWSYLNNCNVSPSQHFAQEPSLRPFFDVLERHWAEDTFEGVTFSDGDGYDGDSSDDGSDGEGDGGTGGGTTVEPGTKTHSMPPPPAPKAKAKAKAAFVLPLPPSSSDLPTVGTLTSEQRAEMMNRVQALQYLDHNLTTCNLWRARFWVSF